MNFCRSQLTSWQRKLKSLKNIRHDILYYGDIPRPELAGLITKHHSGSSFIKPVVPPQVFMEKETLENKILFAPYDASQARLQTTSRDARMS